MQNNGQPGTSADDCTGKSLLTLSLECFWFKFVLSFREHFVVKVIKMLESENWPIDCLTV